MNIQELIKEYEGACFAMVTVSSVLEDLKQLDEPQKVTIPKFVVDWIERSKQEGRNLRNALNNGGEKMRLWFLEQKNYDIFARAWLDGYTVEKEKRYLVKAKGVCFNSCLIFEKINKTWLFSSIYETDHQIGCHTRKELEEAGFGEVFNSPLFEVEEVEE